MTIQDGFYAFDNDLNSLIMALNGCYVVSGLAVTEDSPLDMGVVIAAGTYYANGTKVVKGSETDLPLDASDPTYPRKDLIVGDSAGTISFVKGTAQIAMPSTETGPKTYQPKPPDIPSGNTLLAEVWVGAGVNSIVNANITDRRVVLGSIGHPELVGVTADQHHVANALSYAEASATLTLTTTKQDVAGCSLSLPAGIYLITGIFAFRGDNQGSYAIGYLDVGGVDQTCQAQWKPSASAASAGTPSFQFKITLGSTTTVKLEANKDVDVGAFTCQIAFTTITAMRVAS